MTDRSSPAAGQTKPNARKTKGRKPSQREYILNAGSRILYEKVAEAFEPDWQDLIERMFIAMRTQERIP
jgi:hypothetical protein